MSFLFNRFARFYDRFMSLTGLNNEKLLITYICTGQPISVVDIGGGTGRLASLLSDQGVQVTIVDPCRAMTDLAKKRDNRIEVINSDILDVPIGDSRFDAVCMKDCLHHIPNKEAALKEAIRILKPGGRLVIHEFNSKCFMGVLILVFERILGEKSVMIPHEQLSRMLANNGIDGEVHGLNKFEYIFVGRKLEHI